jgi:hypothetical protein
VAAAIVAVLLLGLATTTSMFLRERAAHKMAEAATHEAEQANQRTLQALNQVELEKAATEEALKQTKIAKEEAEKEQAIAELTSYNISGKQFEKLSAERLPREDRTRYFAQKLKLWRDIMVEGQPFLKKLEKYPDEYRIRHLKTDILGALAKASFEAGDAEAKKAAQEWLASSTNPKDWEYGDVIHDANALLGRLAMREGDPKAAGDYLLKAGQTPGSPILDSSGPRFVLAAELLAAGEKQVILDYLDLVEKFWVQKEGAK